MFNIPRFSESNVGCITLVWRSFRNKRGRDEIWRKSWKYGGKPLNRLSTIPIGDIDCKSLKDGKHDYGVEVIYV